MPVLSKRIVLDCFYLLIFYFEKFSTDVCRLPCAVNVNLNLSTVNPSRSKIEFKERLSAPFNERLKIFSVYDVFGFRSSEDRQSIVFLLGLLCH